MCSHHQTCRVSDKNIGTPKMRNDYGAIQLLIFCYHNIGLFSIAPCKIIALILVLALFVIYTPFALTDALPRSERTFRYCLKKSKKER